MLFSHIHAQEIWNMHDIYIWHFLLKSFGTKKTFKYLQYRLEHNQNMVPIVTLLLLIFTVSWLITFWFKFSYWRRQFRYQNSLVLLKRFILHVNPNLSNVIERTPLIRTRPDVMNHRANTNRDNTSRGNIARTTMNRTNDLTSNDRSRPGRSAATSSTTGNRLESRSKNRTTEVSTSDRRTNHQEINRSRSNSESINSS